MHTSANSSHIRVALKDDNLGLGAKRGSGQVEGQCTGLDAFQGLLGRLNGRSDAELQKAQDAREDLKRATYTERRWGSVRFVKGGLLIGDKIQDLAHAEAARLRTIDRQAESEHPEPPSHLEIRTESKVRKIKRPTSASSEPQVPGRRKKEKEETRKSGSRINAGQEHDERSVIITNPELRKRKNTIDKVEVSSNAEHSSPESEELPSSNASASELKQRKTEQRRLKGERKATKEAKRLRRNKGDSASSGLSEAVKADVINSDGTSGDRSSRTRTKAAPSSTTTVPAGRHAVRYRYIQQKKLAVMDTKSLNEVRHISVVICFSPTKLYIDPDD